MKRIGAILTLALITVMLSASFCFAGQGDLKLDENYPKDGATGTSIDNLSVKLYFSEDVKPKKGDDATVKANEKAIKMTDNKGKEIPLIIKYNPDQDKQGQVLVLADVNGRNSGEKDKKTTIKSDTKYHISIAGSFKATNGDTLGDDQKISFTTINQSRSMKIQMLMMGLMVVVMIVFMSRSAKKQVEKEMSERKKVETVNPYKEAKKTGKSVEDIVKKDQQKKAKQAAAAERKEAKKKRDSGGAVMNEIASDNKRVSGPRPISAAGSKYVAPVKKKKPEKTKTTNPKNQTGKQKNAKNQGNKKKK